MAITKPRLLGRYTTGYKAVNMYTGRNMQRGTDHYFYYKSGTKVILSDEEFHHNWKKLVLKPEQIRRQHFKELMSLDKRELVELVFNLNDRLNDISDTLGYERDVKASLHQQLMQGMTSRGGVTVPKTF